MELKLAPYGTVAQKNKEYFVQAGVDTLNWIPLVDLLLRSCQNRLEDDTFILGLLKE